MNVQCVAISSAFDRPFNGFRIAKSDSARAVVNDVLGQVQKLEIHYKHRQRARRPDDQKVFEHQVESVVCDLAHAQLTLPGCWTAIPFSKSVLSRRDRYRPPVLTKTLPDVVRRMAFPELAFVEWVRGTRHPFTPPVSA